VVHGEGQAFFQETSAHHTVLSFKRQISQQVGLCPSNIQLIDTYRNSQQDTDGHGEYLDHRTLSAYGITEYKKGAILYAVRRVVINDFIVPKKHFATIGFLDFSAFKRRLDGYQTVLELKQTMCFYLSCRDLSRLVLFDWYDNQQVYNDGGLPLDDQPLARYGWDDQHTGVVVYVAEDVPNNLHGSATLFYGKGFVQSNIPFKQTQTVLQFKIYLSKLTGLVPAENILIIDYSNNPAQDADDGIWRDHKTLYHYGLRTGAPAALGIALRDSSHPTPLPGIPSSYT